MTELSVVMPCLNEADTIATCVEKAWRAIRAHGIDGEVIVADNGSTDDSREIAARLGARVVPVDEKGYGSALMGGIAAAQGTYVIMGDADDSYDFREVDRWSERLALYQPIASLVFDRSLHVINRLKVTAVR
jgi:glycosyltransferase involved in cell wall biosynthesis